MGISSLLIKTVQVIMLLGGLAAFLYGAYQLGMDLLFLLKGVQVEGIVTGHQVDYESREKYADSSGSGSDQYESVAMHSPTIHYRWPKVNGHAYTHHSSIWYEGEEVDRYAIGSKVMIRVLPSAPHMARLPGAFTHYLWASVGFAAGLFALVIVSSLFFLHEGMFGRDLSKGISLFRSVNWPATIVIVSLTMAGVLWIHSRAFPWLGPQELFALVTGDIWKLPPLLASKGEPPPGRYLNEAESTFASIPLIGIAYADQALESALLYEKGDLTKRYLSALADPKSNFHLKSVRALAYAAEKGNTDAVKALLAYGIHPDTSLREWDEPIRMAAQYNQPAVIELLMAAGARTDYPAYPLVFSAIYGKAADASKLLIERVPFDAAWRQPHTERTLADLALLNGMASTAALLSAKGSPNTLPQFFRYVAADDPSGLEKVLPRSQWTTTQYEYSSLLHLAARFHGMVLARQLLDMGADPNERIFDEASMSRTPLIEAILAGDMEMVRFLASRPGIKLDQGDATHVPPLGRAVAENRWDIARFLGDAGAGVNCQIGDMDGNTPLHIAASRGDAKHVQWLMSKGADRGFKNFRQLTPVDVAESAEVMKLLGVRQ